MLLIFACILFIVLVSFWSVKPIQQTVATTPVTSTETPTFSIETVASSLDRPWDVAFLPSDQLLYTERSGTLSTIQDGSKKTISTISDVKSSGEGGLMGLAVDAEFTDNRFIYTCYTTATDVRVVRFKLSEDGTAVTDKLPIVTGIFSGKGSRHQGCRMAFGPDGYLWLGTGDAASAGTSPQTPQDPKSLAGKIVRIDRDGNAASGNLAEPFDPRIYSYGHRNVQGIAFPEAPIDGIIGFNAEHGSSVDDEVNALKPGNFGWDPDIAYTERDIPMTDKAKFPDSIDATWNSGSSTQAPSGLAAIKGTKWKAWSGALALAMQKTAHLKIIFLDQAGKFAKEERILTDKGRLRDVEQAPDGSLYVSTDNGSGKDEIIRLVPN